MPIQPEVAAHAVTWLLAFKPLHSRFCENERSTREPARCRLMPT